MSFDFSFNPNKKQKTKEEIKLEKIEIKKVEYINKHYELATS